MFDALLKVFGGLWTEDEKEYEISSETKDEREGRARVKKITAKEGVLTSIR